MSSFVHDFAKIFAGEVFDSGKVSVVADTMEEEEEEEVEVGSFEEELTK